MQEVYNDSGRSTGLFFNSIFLSPAAIAPDDTIITWRPDSIKEFTCFERDAITDVLRSLLPVSTLLPSFITIRLAFSIYSLLFIISFQNLPYEFDKLLNAFSCGC
eukprot:TRINITY_DN9708_c0_g2_i1.p3 TRINITY_DN9708_c0_g2~~TRINITY_DN9708_c0_g2_i1.p3  ORF type:complete len:105 (+),score=4.32 TRINITY_DN9708_c0_g2_i1:73-387(+)